MGLKVDKSGAKIAALFRTSVAAICIPVFSPAGILAFHLFLRNAWATHLTLISRMQKWVARNLGLNKFDKIGNHFSEGPSWCNLGLWEDGKKELAFSLPDEDAFKKAVSAAKTYKKSKK